MFSLGFIVAIVVVVGIVIALALRREETTAKKSAGAPKTAEREIGELTDHSPSKRLTCFPTCNPLTGEALKFDSKCDEAALRKADLPVAGTIDDLARVMGIESGELRWLMSEDANHYTPIELKGRGKRRLVFAPKFKMKACQRWILKNILDKMQPHPAAEGFRKGRSVLTHAKKHAGKYAVGSLDIHRFFDTVRSKRVFGVYRKMGYSEEAALALCLLTTRKGRLPQGAPTSPALANLVCRRMDARLEGISRKLGATYSRYADDMAFSGDKEFAKNWGRFRDVARKILKDEGFRLNPLKVHFMRSGSRQYVTGLVINKKPNIPRERLRLMRSILHNAKATGLDAQNRSGNPGWKERLRGQISYISMIRPDRGQRLMTAFGQLN